MASPSGPWSRPVSVSEDPSKFGRLAERVRGAMALAVHPAPMRIPPSSVGISPKNRLFSAHQVHNTILVSFNKDGHDPDRPHVGVCCEVRDPGARKALEDYNKSLAQNSTLMPKVEDGVIQYEGLACSHYNTALRLVHEARLSPAGDLAALKHERPGLADAASLGHWWIVLPESLSESLKKDICTWRNQDQNENQALSDGELIRMAKLAVHQFMAKAGSGKVDLPLQHICTAACLATPLKLNPTVMGSFCKFVCQMASEGKMHLVEEFLQFWSASVDPRKIAIPHTFFDAMSRAKHLDTHSLVRMHMAMAMYCEEGSLPKAKPTPDQAGLFSAKDMDALGKHPDSVALASAALDRLHKVYKPLLAAHLPPHLVREECVSCGTLVVRLLHGKAVHTQAHGGSWPPCPVLTGTITEDKMNKLLGWWAKHVDDSHPHVKFGQSSGLDAHAPMVIQSKDDVVFTVPGRRLSSKTPSEPKDPAGPAASADTPLSTFKIGEAVCLLRRMSPLMPLPDNPNFRKDLRQGAEATIVSLADAKHKSKVEILAPVMHKGERMEIRTWVACHNLVLASDAPTDMEEASGSTSPLPDIIIGEPVPGMKRSVEVIPDWTDLLDEHAPAANLVALKASATFAMRMVMSVMPTLEEGKDLILVHRFNVTGARRTEVWTKRKFEPGELMIAPWTHEIKERLWTTGLAVSLGVPPQSVPGNRVLALDGRLRNQLSHANARNHVQGAVGNLFWVIGRTQVRSCANMAIDYCCINANNGLRVSVPGAQGGSHLIKASSVKIPKIPILVNKAALPEHTLLLAHDDPVVARAREEDKGMHMAKKAKTE